MTVKVIKRENGAEYLLDGRLDTTTAPEVEGILVEAVGKYENLTLNLKDLAYISSAGLRVMKRMYMESRKQNHQLVIKNTGKMVMEVFEMTGFAGLFTFE